MIIKKDQPAKIDLCQNSTPMVSAGQAPNFRDEVAKVKNYINTINHRYQVCRGCGKGYGFEPLTILEPEKVEIIKNCVFCKGVNHD